MWFLPAHAMKTNALPLRARASASLESRFPQFWMNSGNSTESTYTAWPERLYLIDANGRVAYKSKPGPFGFKPDELQAALRKAVPGR